MSTIRPYQDMETRRQYRNHTSTQQKNLSALKEGVIVNNLIKEPIVNLSGMYDSLIIPEKISLSDKYNFNEPKEHKDKSLKNLILTTVGVFGVLTAATGAIALAAKYKKDTLKCPWKFLPEVPKNININDEPHFATYLMIQNPNTKTILGALGVFVLSAVGLVGKNFVDGVRSIWVRKKEADVHRDLQERLIETETRSFSGKMQILRNMLSEKAHELEGELHKNNLSLWDSIAFKKFINFKHKETNDPSKATESKDNKKMLATIALSTLGMIGLGIFAFKNIQKTAKFYQDYTDDVYKGIKEMAANSDVDSEGLETIRKLCVTLRFTPQKIEEVFNAIKKPKFNKDEINIPDYIKKVAQEVESITQKPARELAGTPGDKAMYISFTDDDRAHLYNMIVNPDNPVLKLLFAGMTTVTAAGYMGSAAVEAVKDVEVIKENANTEYNLQNRLVNVELKNFETKKRSVIEPLIDEFKKQAKEGKNKEELKVRAENILYEIKNGPPFVYS